MPGDYTRFTFDPFEDHFGVLMQQGRVMLDSDFNEWVETLGRQLRVRMLDTVGPCVVPRETMTGFEIRIVGNTLTIGRGRAYVDGLLAENHGADATGRPVTLLDADALEYDPVLEERRGLHPIAFEQQPYLPNAAAMLETLNRDGTALVYLDVWKREVTHLQEPDLVEKAVGVDTATRVQVVWQVKILAVPRDTTCATPDDGLPDWQTATAPSAARLTTGAVGVPASDDPCIINPNGGYRGTENRLYRVEVHDGGTAATATFKWSRDNASIKTSVVAMNGGLDVLTVTRVGRDSVRRFSPGQWIEVIDDHLELVQSPGVMRRILEVDDVNQRITLDTALPAGVFDPTDLAARHTRILRWDQSGQVLDPSNTVIDDVDTNGGVIRVAAGAGTMVLEDGVEVAFSEDPAGGQYHTGDYWVFAARTVDASVESLVEAPPRGIAHHYCRLAVVTLPNQPLDCRIFWPPDFGGAGCDCDECVTAESHNSGSFTIQAAIDRVRAEGGKICLGPGLFILGQTPLVVSAAQSIQIEGDGWRTVLVYAGAGAAIGVTGSIGVDISKLSVIALSFGDFAGIPLAIQNAALVRVKECLLAQIGGGDRSGPAVGLNGAIVECVLCDNILFGAAGIAALARGLDDEPAFANRAMLAAARAYTLIFGLTIEQNLVLSTQRGISLANLTLHLGDTRISSNRFIGSQQVGILSTGIVLSQVMTTSRIDVLSNSITTQGVGVALSGHNTRVAANDIGILGSNSPQQPSADHGILVMRGILPAPIEHAQILSNRILGIAGDAIHIDASIASAMIKQNVIDACGGGIVMTDDAEAEILDLEDNQLLNVLPAGDVNQPVAAIRVFRARQVNLSQNTIQSFAFGAVGAPSRCGIEVTASNVVRVVNNSIERVGPPGGFARFGAGIFILSPFDWLDVSNNNVRRSDQAVAADNSVWFGIAISGVTVGVRPDFDSIATLVALGRAVFLPLTAATGAANNRVLVLGSNFAAVLPQAPDRGAVRANAVESYGSASAVRIAIQGSMHFAENLCLAQILRAVSPAVEIDAASAVVGNNQIERSPSSDANVALDVNVGNGPFTLVGNICRGGTIRVNGTPLGAPWAPLNAVRFP